MNRPKPRAEFLLGLVGGLVGILMGALAIFLGGAEAVVENIENSTIVAKGWGAVFLSLIGIAASFISKNKPKLGGAFMLGAAIGGFLCIYMFYVMPGVLLGVAGLIALNNKRVEAKSKQS